MSKRNIATKTCACLLAFSGMGSWMTPVFAADYYLNAITGVDINPGTQDKPWKSLGKASQQRLSPGDRILLARGSAFVGHLKVTQSGTQDKPILVTAYGEGDAPRLMNPRFTLEYGRIVSVYGSYVTVENLYLYDGATPPPDEPPLPWKESHQHRLVTDMAGIYTDATTHHVTIQSNEFNNIPVGVRVRGAHSLVKGNSFHDASRITEYWGAMAIVIVGPHNEVAHNRIENYGFYGGAYVNDGAAVELDGEDRFFDAHDTWVHHNLSRNTKGGFLEIAGNTHDVTIEHNISDDVDKFVGTNGIRNLKIASNFIIRTRIPDITDKDFWSLRSLFWSICWNGCEGDRDAGVRITDNIFYLSAPHRIYMGTDNPHGFMSAVHEGNLYWSPDGDAAALLGQPLGPREAIADPGFGPDFMRALRIEPTQMQ